jgi:riboflavin biosynthesis pyrimidine reductase
LILTSQNADATREVELTRAGAEVVRLPVDGQGNVCLERALSELGRCGFDSVMVAGGGEVITSFLRSRRVDQLILTIALVLVGGLPAVGTLRHEERTTTPPTPGEVAFPRLRNVSYERVGDDLVLTGDPDWDAAAGRPTWTNGDA